MKVYFSKEIKDRSVYGVSKEVLEWAKDKMFEPNPWYYQLKKEMEEKKMELKDNECRIYYKGKERFLPFEKELEKLFKDNGFERWASGYDMQDGIRDLCFDKKEEEKMDKQQLDKIEHNLYKQVLSSVGYQQFKDVEIGLQCLIIIKELRREDK